MTLQIQLPLCHLLVSSREEDGRVWYNTIRDRRGSTSPSHCRAWDSTTKVNWPFHSNITGLVNTVFMSPIHAPPKDQLHTIRQLLPIHLLNARAKPQTTYTRQRGIHSMCLEHGIHNIFPWATGPRAGLLCHWLAGVTHPWKGNHLRTSRTPPLHQISTSNGELT